MGEAESISKELFYLLITVLSIAILEVQLHLLSETAAAHPRAASCGASKAPPHENGTR